MKTSKRINSARELDEVLKDYFDNIKHTDADYYLKYPIIDLVIEKPISNNKYTLLIKSKKISTYCLYIQQAMNLLLGNYLEFHEALKCACDPWANSINDIDLYKSLLARKLSNLFSSSYAYTEHTKKLYNQIKGSPSFDQLKEHHIDRDLMILEDVRNYAQHTGLPIHNLILNGDGDPQIFVDKQVLLENKDKNKGNIESYVNDRIPVSQYIPQYVKKVWELHNAVMNLLESSLKLSFDQIEASIDEMKELSKKEKLTHCDVITNKDGYIKTTALSKNIKQLIEHYVMENKKLIDNLFSK